MDDSVVLPSVRSGLVSRIYTSSSTQKYLGVFAVGVSGEWARFSKVQVGSNALSSTWQHEIIPRPSGAPSRFLSSLAYPTLTQAKERHIPVPNLGFCAESAEEGEIYHIYKYVPSPPLHQASSTPSNLNLLKR